MTALFGNGWWEQEHYGRQPMHDLQLTFDNDMVDVRGWDVIGPFRMRGKIAANQVLLIKHYLGQHDVEYAGTYDGEGVLAGKWRIGEFTGRWLMKVSPASRSDDDEIKSIE